MNTNIEGLSATIGALNRKIELLEREIKSFDVQGGNHVLVSRFNNNFVVDSIQGDGDGQESHCPWRLNVSEEEEDKYKLSTNGGMVNDLLPDNYDNIATLGDEDAYVYYEAETDYNGIVSLTIKTSGDQPDTEKKFEEEALPTSVLGLIGIYNNGGISYQMMCDHIKIKPQVAYQINDPDNYHILKTYFTWDVS